MKPPSADRPVLELTGLTAGYADRPAVVQGIDLQVAAGSLIGIIGESGGGKSTLLNAILGRPDGGLAVRGGTICYRGVDITEIGRAHV